MSYSSREARDRIIGDLESAEEELSASLGSLGEAFELLAEASADRLEGELFRPVQRAAARCKRTRTSFSERVDQPTDEPPMRPVGPPSQGAKAFIQEAARFAGEADHILSELQDSMMPVEAGDPELRAGISEVRELLAPVPNAAAMLLRGLGR